MFLHRKYFVIGILIIITVIYGCTPLVNTATKPRNKIVTIFSITPENEYITENFNTFYTSTDFFKGSLLLRNTSNKRKQYAILTFLDNKQFPFSLNNSYANFNLVELNPREVNSYKYELTNLPKGEHDLIWLCTYFRQL